MQVHKPPVSLLTSIMSGGQRRACVLRVCHCERQCFWPLLRELQPKGRGNAKEDVHIDSLASDFQCHLYCSQGDLMKAGFSRVLPIILKSGQQLSARQCGAPTSAGIYDEERG